MAGKGPSKKMPGGKSVQKNCAKKDRLCPKKRLWGERKRDGTASIKKKGLGAAHPKPNLRRKECIRPTEKSCPKV